MKMFWKLQNLQTRRLGEFTEFYAVILPDHNPTTTMEKISEISSSFYVKNRTT